MKYLALAALLIAAPALADDKGNGKNGNGNGNNGNNWSLGVSLGGTAGAFNNTFSGAQGSAWSDGLNAQGAGYSSSGAQALAMLCQSPRVREAMATAGSPCPGQRATTASAQADPYFYDRRGRRYVARQFPDDAAAKRAGARRADTGEWVVLVR